MNLKFRWVLIVIVIGWSLYAMYPLKEKIKLGLDLQGGMHVVLGVDTDKAVEAKIDNIVTQLRKDLTSKDTGVTYVQREGNNIKIGLTDAKFHDTVSKSVKDTFYYLESKGGGNDTTLVFDLSNNEIDSIRKYAVDQSTEVITNRIDQFGVSEPIIQKQGASNIVVQLPGVTDPDRAIGLIGQTAQLKFHLVDPSVSQADLEAGRVPFDDIILYNKVVDKQSGKVISTHPYAVKREAALTGDYLTDARMAINNNSSEMYYVSISFDPAGAKLFEEITANNVGKQLAIVLDNNIYSAPVLREKIAGGNAQITGNFSDTEARDLAIVLRAGSLPAPVSILENRTVGPSLGLDSIKSGIYACLIGLGAIMLFMGIYYRLSGWVANFALFLNLVLLLGVLATMKATLTLPGIAGVILTLGLAVDANVLIFERVREELRLGRTVLNAIEIGYSKAFMTIVDANVTSLIAAVVLFQFGTGPIKGFAVTLSVGILASMFTAIYVTKTIFMTALRKRDVKHLSI